MGAVGGMLGLNGGAGGTGFSTNAGTNAGQLGTSYTQNQQVLNELQGQNGIGNQSNVYNQMQAVAAGQGPNPAQAALNQATGANVANQASLMAGQRGAASNVGLMARQAAQQGANTQQQAAGQGATMQAQQSLNALGAAGNMANTMAGNQVQATQNEQNILQGANTSNNATQAGLANTQMQGGQALTGGLMNGIGGAAALAANGGQVQRYDQGGMTMQPNMGVTQGPQSNFAQSMMQQSAPSMPTTQNQGAAALQSGVQNAANKTIQALKNIKPKANANFAGADTPSQDVSNMAAKGGMVKALVSPGEVRIPKDKVREVAGGEVNPLKVGEKFPGTPKYKGNDYRNDTIPKKLPVGDVIIPNKVMQSKDPVRGAAEFVRDVLAKKGKKK
jgi:hypothetical protein